MWRQLRGNLVSLLGDTGVRQSRAYPGELGFGLGVMGQHVTKISIIVTLCQPGS